MFEAIEESLDICLNSYITKCEQASKKVEKLLVRLDAMLDKSLDDEHPTYACGNALEEVKQVLDDTALQLNYTKDVVCAKVGAWGTFPGDHEGDDDARRGYIYGYMQARGL